MRVYVVLFDFQVGVKSVGRTRSGAQSYTDLLGQTAAGH